MYVEPWMFWLLLAPLAAVSAIYLGYLAMILLGLLSISIGLGFSLASEWLARRVPTCPARTATWILTPLVAPFKQHGPWLDYAVVAVLLVGVSLGAVLWLAV